MKKRIIQGIAIFALAVVTLTASAVSDDRVFDEYEISPVAVQNLDVKADKAWVLSYDANESPIVITLCETKHGRTYLVKADHFEVAYVSGKNGFGARNVSYSQSTVPYEFTSSVINAEELAKQKIITPNSVDDDFALGLIASYLPDLVNPSYKHLLN
ncbi:hypothetical protein ACUNWD_02460 [Sunxiuqinia sp. A32]|uniref:hypothetical protein n=1 Tax=Sunxiuqinia sp. A32 TaxID=3461496 RepID=UPI00404656EE